jgi:hypothetical protein
VQASAPAAEKLPLSQATQAAAAEAGGCEALAATPRVPAGHSCAQEVWPGAAAKEPSGQSAQPAERFVARGATPK